MYIYFITHINPYHYVTIMQRVQLCNTIAGRNETDLYWAELTVAGCYAATSF